MKEGTTGTLHYKTDYNNYYYFIINRLDSFTRGNVPSNELQIYTW